MLEGAHAHEIESPREIESARVRVLILELALHLLLTRTALVTLSIVSTNCSRVTRVSLSTCTRAVLYATLCVVPCDSIHYITLRVATILYLVMVYVHSLLFMIIFIFLG